MLVDSAYNRMVKQHMLSTTVGSDVLHQDVLALQGEPVR